MSPLPRRLAVWCAAPVVALSSLGAMAASAPHPFLVNESRSLAAGLYVRRDPEPLSRGVTVAIAQPVQTQAYLRALGAPPDMLLLKRVVAVPGDWVCRAGDRLVLPARTVEVRELDRHGRQLPSWTGCRLLERDEVFLLGDTATSFDSRYFGPVRRSRILGVYEGVLTW